MIELPIISFRTLKANMSDYDCYEKDVLIANLDEYLSSSSQPVRTSALQVLLVLEGTVEISLDYTYYKVEANSMVIIMPSHISKILSASENYKGLLLLVSRSFLEQAVLANNFSSMIQYMNIRKNPAVLLSQQEMKVLEDCFVQIRKTILLKKHNLHRMLLQNVLINFFIEMENIYLERDEYIKIPSLSRSEEVFDSFLRLLYQNFKKEHGVFFYADKLSITPQYLSIILKKLSGKPPYKWIEETLLQEAKIMLKTSDVSMHEIALSLNFADQSTFGKFFKKRTGVSPLGYRKKHR